MVTKERAARLLYQGFGDRTGDYFTGVPARDLESEDIAELTDEQYGDITGGPSPLYIEPVPQKPPKEQKES